MLPEERSSLGLCPRKVFDVCASSDPCLRLVRNGRSKRFQYCRGSYSKCPCRLLGWVQIGEILCAGQIAYVLALWHLCCTPTHVFQMRPSTIPRPTPEPEHRHHRIYTSQFHRSTKTLSWIQIMRTPRRARADVNSTKTIKRMGNLVTGTGE